MIPASTISATGNSTMTDQPMLDRAYLDDMRQWVGDATLASLMDTAPQSFAFELAALKTAWGSGDLAEFREVAHRLKGAAGSIGCRQLSERASTLQGLGDDADGERNRLLDQLPTLIEQSLQALRDYHQMTAAIS